VKEKRNYKRFELIPFLAILGCIGMLLFECIFIFELYDRAPAEIVNLIPSPVSPPAAEKPAPVAVQTNLIVSPAESGLPSVTNATPAKVEPVPPVAPVG
jgi:hypothetical protein